MLAFASLSFLLASASAFAVKRQSAVSCTAVHSGEVRIYSNDQAAKPLPTDGANITVFYTPEPNDPGFLVVGSTGTTFQFLECDSSFMGYSASANTTYGHLVSTDYGGCITVNLTSSEGSPYLTQNEACSTSDDESQLLQYWSLTTSTVHSTGALLYQLNFLGVTADGTTYDDAPVMEMLPQLNSLDEQTTLTIAAYTKSFILYALRFAE